MSDFDDEERISGGAIVFSDCVFRNNDDLEL